MDPEPPSPLTPLSSLPQTSLQKASEPSLTPSSAQLPSPEHKCACPCGPFEVKLKAATTLMTFGHYPLPTLVPSPYPKDMLTGKRIPVSRLSKYSRLHVWPDDIHCFCSLRPGVETRSVRLFVSPQRSLCLGCPDRTLDGMGGCRYFVDLKELLHGSEAIPLRSFPIRTQPQAGGILTSSEAHPSPTDTLSSVLSPPSVQPGASSDQGHPTLTFGVNPGLVTDPKRIWSPPPPGIFDRVEDMLLPAASEVREVFDEMVNGNGVSYGRLMGVIGKCLRCNQVMTLPSIQTHPCIGHTKEPGPCPSKHPLLPEDKRALPAAGSRIREWPDGWLGPIEAANVDVVGVVSQAIGDDPNCKRKVSFSTSPQHVSVPATKKPRITSDHGPSQTPGATQLVKTETVSPVRIPTPENSRDIYRDRDEEFIMYEKV